MNKKREYSTVDKSWPPWNSLWLRIYKFLGVFLTFNGFFFMVKNVRDFRKPNLRATKALQLYCKNKHSWRQHDSVLTCIISRKYAMVVRLKIIKSDKK